MATLVRSKRVIVKIGSALLVDAKTGDLRVDWLAGLAKDVAWLRDAGTDVVLVSSGSIALGRSVLGFANTTLSLDQSQAAAAVGQIRLARAYEQALSPRDIKTAQILLTLDDSVDRRRYLNSRATLSALLGLGVVPIVNENDTVATDEIRFGDNDRLAAQVASMVGADVLVLLSDVDGLYTANPKSDPTAKKLDEVTNITPEIEKMAGGAGSENAKGGMRTKVMAAKTATQAGCDMVVMLGDIDQPLQALAKGVPHTVFRASVDPHQARKQWISGMKPKGSLLLDDGAVRALQAGKSLLPAGVTTSQGSFVRGDMVLLCDAQGQDFAKGLVNYDGTEVQAIAGRQSSEIKDILGYPGRAVLVHRDDMVI